MSDNSEKETNIKSTIDAVTGLAKAIPIYDDALQPAAREIGKTLSTVAKTVNIAIAPIKALVWGYEQIENFVNTKVSEKLEQIPKERISSPPPEVVGPALEALKYTGHKESLRNLFANLIANSMDTETVDKTHPGYVEILRNISHEEAKILKVLSNQNTFPIIDIRSNDKKGISGGQDIMKNFSLIGREIGYISIDLDFIPSRLENLCRLGILEIPSGMSLVDKELYKPLKESEEAKLAKIAIEKHENKVIKFTHKYITLTTYGKRFCEVCINDK